MEILEIAKSLLNNSTGEQTLVNAVADLVGSQGGIHRLVEQFGAHGLGSVVESWIAHGDNMPVDGEQLSKVLGAEKIEALAGKVGSSPDDLKSALASLLPAIVNHLTPNGQINAENFSLANLMQAGQKLLAEFR